MKRTLICFVSLILVTMPSSVFAASSWTEETPYPHKVKEKLAFGMGNVLAGWTEILAESENEQDEGKNPWHGASIGFCHAVIDTLGGALHVATFPFTSLDIPLPNGGVDL